jgi:hypothetical protein
MTTQQATSRCKELATWLQVQGGRSGYSQSALDGQAVDMLLSRIDALETELREVVGACDKHQTAAEMRAPPLDSGAGAV